MPISVRWDNEDKTILRYRYEGQWNWEDAHKAIKEATEMTEKVNHIVDAIIDMQASQGIPLGGITQFRTTRKFKPSNRGIIVILSANPLFNTLPKIVQRTFPNALGEYQVAKSEEEVLNLIEKAKHERQSKKEAGKKPTS